MFMVAPICAISYTIIVCLMYGMCHACSRRYEGRYQLLVSKIETEEVEKEILRSYTPPPKYESLVSV